MKKNGFKNSARQALKLIRRNSGWLQVVGLLAGPVFLFVLGLVQSEWVYIVVGGAETAVLAFIAWIFHKTPTLGETLFKYADQSTQLDVIVRRAADGKKLPASAAQLLISSLDPAQPSPDQFHYAAVVLSPILAKLNLKDADLVQARAVAMLSANMEYDIRGDYNPSLRGAMRILSEHPETTVALALFVEGAV